MTLSSRVRRRSAASALVAAVILLGLAGCYVFSGRGAGLLPQASWGPWREKPQVNHWGVWVRVNSWSNAAEASVHMGKAEDFTMKAYGTRAGAVTVMDGTRFTLTPDGRLTGQWPQGHVTR
ncbi:MULTISPECIES: hypothetical protein [unclassified Streptomyces]|uniref:hypothetical protein n=1 Tax=unclassified Streptomyces TaxID=2593676 RepID=UPI0007F987FB|nr:hypothetical protein [Streptomyces sp. SAT1]ANO42237.1 hypothetical protein A8713_033825 [Streptomyces sp. SAT1]